MRVMTSWVSPSATLRCSASPSVSKGRTTIEGCAGNDRSMFPARPATPSGRAADIDDDGGRRLPTGGMRSEEHTSELQSLLRISYAVFCLKKKTTITATTQHNTQEP